MKTLLTLVLTATVVAAAAGATPASGELFDELARMDRRVLETAFVGGCPADEGTSRGFSFDHQSLKPGEKRTGTVDAELLATMKRLDAIVFEAGYNNCEIDRLASVVAEDLEFYHDQAGAMYGKDAFLDSMKNGICRLDYKARRELVDGSMQVFPLYDNGELYGAIQSGTHRFHAKYPGKAEVPTGIAKFSSLWLLEGDDWKLSRVLSFDHRGLD